MNAPAALAPRAYSRTENAVSSDRGTPTVRLRLTRRGRVVVTALLAAPIVTLTLLAALNGGGAVAAGEQSRTIFEYVTVESGQSLWDVAGDIAPVADPRDVITEIMTLNRLGSAVLQPGQQIAVPEKYATSLS